MIASIAYIAGFELDNDEIQAFVYACLAGVTVGNIIKEATTKFGIKFTTSLLKKLLGKVITKINQKVGFRLMTKFGSKGIINLSKMIHVVGAAIGGSMDIVETKIIANRAYNWFFKNDFEDEHLDDIE